MGIEIGAPFGPGAADARAAIAYACSRLDVYDPVAGEKLFGFRERTVAHDLASAEPPERTMRARVGGVRPSMLATLTCEAPDSS